MRAGFGIRAMPDFQRHRPTALFQDMAHKAYGSRHNAEAATNLPGQAQLAADCPDRPRCIDRQVAAVSPFSLLRVTPSQPGY
jgi:hypothetical protein